jgi:hypothetical protein
MRIPVTTAFYNEAAPGAGNPGSQMNKLKLALCLVTTFFAWAKGAEA